MCPEDITGQSSSAPTDSSGGTPAKVFLSYGRRDTQRLADRLKADLESRGYQVWLDKSEIKAGREWEEEIKRGLRDTQVVLALLSPHAVRLTGDPGNPDNLDSVCLDELSYARRSLKPIVPVMAIPCEPPFSTFRLHYVNLVAWEDPEKYEAGLQEVQEALQGALAGRVRYRDWDFRLHPWDFSAFVDDKRRGFVGRAWLFREIEHWLDRGGEPALLILGDPGIGKSALAAELIHRNPPQLLAYHCCQADTQATLDPGRLVRSLAAMAASRLPAYANLLRADPAVPEALSEASCGQDPGSAFEAGLLTPLSKIPAPGCGCHYLLIDALDESLARQGKGPSIVALLASRLSRLPPWLRLVATTRREPEVLERLRGLRARQLDAQEPQNLEDLQAYIEGRLTEPPLKEMIAAAQASAAEVSRTLREKSQGIFLYAQQALLGLERGIYDLASLDRLPPGLTPLYRSFFERQFPDQDSFGEVRPLLEVAAAAREPLTSKDLAAITGLKEDYDLAPRLRRLAAYLPASQGRYAFFHKSLVDWLTGAEQKGSLHYVSVTQGQAVLADRGWREYQGGVAGMSRYMVVHLPAHLAAVARPEPLQSLLLDYAWIWAKLHTAGVQSLISDYDLLPEDQDLRMIQGALRLSAHVLSRDVGELPSQLTGRLLGQELPAIQGFLEEIRGKQKDPWLRPLAPSLRPPSGPLRRTLTGHKGYVTAVAVTGDGRTAVSGSLVGISMYYTLKVWNLETGEEIKTLSGNEGSVWAVALTADGHRVVSGHQEGTLMVWDLERGGEPQTMKGHEDRVNAVALSPDGRRAVSGSWDWTLKVWDLESGEELQTLRSHEDRVNAVALSPDGHRAVSGSSDKTLKVWDLEKGEELATLRGHENSVNAVAVTPDGHRVVSGSDDRTLKVWDLEKGEELATLRGHENSVNAVAVTPNGHRVVSGSDDRTLKVWDLEQGGKPKTLRGHGGEVTAVALTLDGRRAVSGSNDRTIKVWDLERGGEPRSLRVHRDDVTAVAVTPSGRQAVSASMDGTLKVWDLERGGEPQTLKRHTGSVTDVAVTPDGRRAVFASGDGTLKVWDLERGGEPQTLKGHEGGVLAIALTPDGRRAVSSSNDDTIKVWDLESGQELHTLRGPEGWVFAVAVTPDGRRAVSGHVEGTLMVWDLERGGEPQTMKGHTGSVWAVALTPDGRRAVSGSWDTLKVWDLERGGEPQTLRGHTGEVLAVALVPDGRRAVSGHVDGTLKVWDLERGGCLATFTGDGAMNACIVAPDGRTIVAGDASGLVHFLRLEGA